MLDSDGLFVVENEWIELCFKGLVQLSIYFGEVFVCFHFFFINLLTATLFTDC